MTNALGFLMDRELVETAATLGLPADVVPDADAISRALAELFAADLNLAAVRIRRGQAVLGTVSRRRLEILLGPLRAAEEGDGAQLPGFSSRYRLLRYRCQAHGCETLELRIVLGEGGPPTCPLGHGPLELTV